MNILEEAFQLTGEDRQKKYGPTKEYFENVATIFNAISNDVQLSAEDVVKVMIATKLARQKHYPKRDNLVDLAGYSWVWQEVLKSNDKK